MDTLDVTVVGAGMAGLACARTLAAAGLSVRVYEREQSVGGRIASRADENGAFDFGAQYFTARDPAFIREVDDWHEAGVVQPWGGRIRTLRSGRVAALHGETPRYIAVPAMQMLPRALAADLDVALGSPVVALEPTFLGWELRAPGARTLARSRRVVLALPPSDAGPLAAATPALEEALAGHPMVPTWCVLARFRASLDLAFDGAFVEHSPLAWIARNNSKPQRGHAECWVLHASHEWSARHRSHPAQFVIDTLMRAFEDATRCTTQPLAARAHWWPNSAPQDALERGYLADEAAGVVACGDWCLGGRVENAFLSGRAAALAVMKLRGL